MDKSEAVIRVMIADDHTIFRDGLKTLIAGEPGFQLAGEACDGDEILRLVGKLKPDILLLDLLMPKVSGMEVLESLAEKHSPVRTILLTGEVSGEDVSKAFELGARGLILKESATAMLFKCMRAVMAGQYWIGRKSVSSLAHTLRQYRDAVKSEKPKNYGLTAREMDIVRAVVSGYPNKGIADLYGISEQTVKHHITNIFDKLGVYNRLELTLFTLHHGLVKE